MTEGISMIRGHDRETLRWALQFATNVSILAEVFVSLGDVDRWRWCHNYAWLDALKGVHDPAKLAAIVAELMRGLGTSVWHGPDEKREPSPADYVLYVIDAGIRVYSPLGPRQWQKQCDMPQARVFALALLDSPQATAQDIERMIGEL